MRSLDERSPRRLGPLVVYDGAEKPWRERWFYAFLAEPFEPSTELVVRTGVNTEPVDQWFRRDEHIAGMAEGWEFFGGPREPGIHVLDLLARPLAAADRETIALALLAAARLSESWRPPDWFPFLDDDFLTFTGGVVPRAVAWVPDSRMEQERWSPPITRHRSAAVLAGILLGETSFDVCLKRARAMARGKDAGLAVQNERTDVIVAAIAGLLRPYSAVPQDVLRAVVQHAPAREALASAVCRGAPDRLAEEQAWHAARAALAPDALADVPRLDRAPPKPMGEGFGLLGNYLVWGATRAQGRSLHAVPATGPLTDLVAVPSETPHQDAMFFRDIVDAWGDPFEVAEMPEGVLALREAAPFPLPKAASAEECVRIALHTARAVTFAPLLMAPSLDCVSMTIDGRVCADGLEPEARTQRYTESPGAWRDAWAATILQGALGLGGAAGSSRVQLVLGEMEEGTIVDISGNAALDGALARALVALTSEMPWAEAQAEIRAACTMVGERLPPTDDSYVRARRSFVRRERDGLVAAVRAREARAPPSPASATKPSRRKVEVAEVREDVGYALSELRELVREGWRRFRG